jgi:RNA polymerase sigma-70 factor (ECF subfamily)
LVEQGVALLDRSAAGTVVSAFHIEAAIAAVHATARSVDETDWGAIVGLYDRLMATAPSPVVALNRAIAIGQRDGPAQGLEALGAISDSERLDRYPFYPAAIGELEFRRGNQEGARTHFLAAAALARNDVERRFLERRVRECGD